ncbi:MAG: homoserine/threonine efflux protein [Rhodospirillales bacterium]|nr:homoserine/threonine efflux protein [Rhodospirillales bacterium]
MIDLGTLTSYAALMLLFALTPGMAVLVTTSQGLQRGFKAGFQAALGIQVANTIYLCLSGLGLAAIFATSALAFAIVKYTGAAYLTWIGLRTIWHARRNANADEPPPPPVWRGAFVQGLGTQLGNPKSILFFGSLLPQFIDPQAVLVPQYAALAIVGSAIETPILAFYAWLASHGRRAALSKRFSLWRERVSGAALIGVGGMLATLRRVHGS